MRRRNFIRDAGLLLGSGLVLPKISGAVPDPKPDYNSWSGIREQFLLQQGYVHMAQMLLASHPKIVRDEIEMHRKNFDTMPVEYWENNFLNMEPVMRTAAAAYIKSLPEEVALTDSTSMGLAVLYTGLKLKPGDEILTSTHDHYATEKSLEFATARNGATIKRISLYEDPFNTSAESIVERVTKAISPSTRVVALTWVHSVTGMKIPVKAISEVIKKANQQRDASKRIYYCVDGVHGFGVENITMADIGCDFFAAGTHKWIFGPRGTGILYGKKDAWDMVTPVIPSFTGTPYAVWMGIAPDVPQNFSDLCTPGGFHSFEHRWSLNKAFEFQQQIGKDKVEQRTHQLNSMLKDGLKQIKHVKLITPLSPDLSSGITCYEVKGMNANDVVRKLLSQKIISSSTPYKLVYARLTPSLVTDENDVKTCVRAIEQITN